MSSKYDTNSLKPPDNWPRIKTIEMHTGGEPLRVILEGFPELEGSNVLEYRSFIKQNHDHLRTALMFEPRGHADMYGVVVTPSEVADFGVVFMHNEGYSTMCGHATLAIAKLAVDAKWVTLSEPETIIKIEAPCGVLTAYVRVQNGEVQHVRFHNVPSYVVDLDLSIRVEGIGDIKYDLAFGGAYYAFVNTDQLDGLECIPENYQQLIQIGKDIKKAVMEQNPVSHPFEKDLSFLYGTIIIGGPVSEGADSRNVCVFADGEVDRSPTGSGVSARVAIHHKRGELRAGEWMTFESIIGSRFRCKIHEVTEFGGYEAVIPEVEGTAFYTGKNEFWIDPEDPYKEGFILR